MGKKRGMSLAEKREVLLQIFSDSEDVFQLKELEKIASKKGINSMVVKDILQGMADDDMIHAEKVGISTYYWIFPSEAGVRLNNLLASLEGELAQAKKAKTQLDCDLATKQALLCESDDRGSLLENLKRLEEEDAGLEAQLAKFADCDPDVYRQMKKGLASSKDSANRWVENLWNLQSWMKKKYPGHDKDMKLLFKQHGVADDLDTIP
mmetsp:Transcript_13213/g.30049  ORF Transcript_13213/g.30049 Transcript_13213/m.30049 type:complete len:208 (-) Transcript_13213:450-1073(-)